MLASMHGSNFRGWALSGFSTTNQSCSAANLDKKTARRHEADGRLILGEERVLFGLSRVARLREVYWNALAERSPRVKR